jgi:hypothetical protein
MQSWLAQVIKKESKDDWRVTRHFIFGEFRIRKCTGSSRSQQHITITPHQVLRASLPASTANHRLHGGNLSAYIENCMLGIAADDGQTCWWSNEGNRTCSGSSTFFSPWFTMPIVLAIRVEDAGELLEGLGTARTPPPKWQVDRLLEVTKGGVQVNYILQSIILYNPGSNHFCSVYHTDRGIWHYDGMMRKGAARVLNIDHLNDAPSQIGVDWVPSCYFYQLQGGLEAQDHLEDPLMQEFQANHQLQVYNGDDSPASCHLRHPEFVIDREAWKKYRRERDGEWLEFQIRQRPPPRPLSHPKYVLQSHKQVLELSQDALIAMGDGQCRCGGTGNSQVTFSGRFIRCDLCQSITHLTCIKGGADRFMREDAENFICRWCSLDGTTAWREPAISDIPLLQYVNILQFRFNGLIFLGTA